MAIRVNLFHVIVTDLRRKTFERAVKLLAAKPRSIAELRERLLRGKGTNQEVVEEVIARLREYGYLNDGPSYVPPVAIGEVMRATGVGQVVASEQPGFAPGDLVLGSLGWQEYATLAPGDGVALEVLPPGAYSSR